MAAAKIAAVDFNKNDVKITSLDRPACGRVCRGSYDGFNFAVWRGRPLWFRRVQTTLSVLTDGPVARMKTEFFTADNVPDAGQPVREHGERGH